MGERESLQGGREHDVRQQGESRGKMEGDAKLARDRQHISVGDLGMLIMLCKNIGVACVVCKAKIGKKAMQCKNQWPSGL